MFVICGEALFDLFMQPDGSPAEARFEARAGGSPFNVAIGMRRLGAKAGLFTAISTDVMGEKLATMLVDEDVSTAYLLRTARKTTLSVISLDAEGVPAYTFYGDDAADTGIVEADLPALGQEVVGLHFGSYSIAVAPVADAALALVKSAGERFISLDPNIRPTVEPDMSIWRARVEALLPHVHLLKISSEDLEVLYPDLTAEAFATQMLAAGVQLVVLTDGGEAARGWTATGLQATVAPPKVDVVDTVGAGDTFMASLLAELGDAPHDAVKALDEAALTRLLQFCANAAAITCTRQGADLPRRADIPTA
ncbi:carbohydrate kinase family protein [Pontivivens insulae]|uniref:Fructokinase n=1 Tax=Pontivivens insulae TaxID=1639689 RepID=A0A2R8A6G7_9RHOB|nr:carbohydrate kinase [Pontivivens insulae]RED17942.1 fructokinase [Pontivivens insulae]SPF27831.1 Fructokinase [Pontivivens insulae]